MHEAASWERVARFIREHLRNLEQLEVLLLAASHPERHISAADASSALGIDADSAAEALEALAASNLLDVKLLDDVRYRVRDDQPIIARDLRELQELYATSRILVIREVTAGRAQRMRDFADAFRIQETKDRDG